MKRDFVIPRLWYYEAQMFNDLILSACIHKNAGNSLHSSEGCPPEERREYWPNRLIHLTSILELFVYFSS